MPLRAASAEARVTRLPLVSLTEKSGASWPTDDPVEPGWTIGRWSSPEGSKLSPQPARTSNTSSRQQFLAKDIADPHGNDIGCREVFAPAILLHGMIPAGADDPVAVGAGIGNAAPERLLAKGAGTVADAIEAAIPFV